MGHKFLMCFVYCCLTGNHFSVNLPIQSKTRLISSCLGFQNYEIQKVNNVVQYFNWICLSLLSRPLHTIKGVELMRLRLKLHNNNMWLDTDVWREAEMLAPYMFKLNSTEFGWFKCLG